MPPTVSIIIPHYNRADLLGETLRSLDAQSFSNWEAIVVDDHSEASQWLRAKSSVSDPRVRMVRRDREPRGPSACRNIGLAHSRGEFIIFLDSDDLLAPWCLETRVAALRDVAGVELMVFAALLFESVSGDRDILWNRLDGEDDLQRFLRSDPPWCVSSPIWRRQALERIGGFNEKLFYGDDAELHVRALLAGLNYRKAETQAMPDAFIRRSENVPRVTGSQALPGLLESRIRRLVEGSDTLRRHTAAPFLVRTWEGQYFVEAEFVLFSTDQPVSAIDTVTDCWSQHQPPPHFRFLVARLYLWLAARGKSHAYLLLRVARRLAMILLPATYFPIGGGFEACPISPVAFDRIRERLEKGSQLGKPASSRPS